MRFRLKGFLFLVMLIMLSQCASGETVSLYGELMVKSDIQKLDLDQNGIKLTNTLDLRNYLDALTNLKSVDMFTSNLSLQEMEALIADYPSISFGFTYRYVKKSIRTDQTAYSTFNRIGDKKYTENSFAPIKYSPGMRALDLGHNAIKDLSFLIPLKELKVLILADNQISDLSPISYLTELEYLELFFNDFIDISPLSNLKKLKDLNLCRNRISDISPLLGLSNLERLWIPDNFLNADQKAALEAALPDCKIVYEWSKSTSFGWREHPRFKVIRRIFQTGEYEPFDM